MAGMAPAREGGCHGSLAMQGCLGEPLAAPSALPGRNNRPKPPWCLFQFTPCSCNMRRTGRGKGVSLLLIKVSTEHICSGCSLRLLMCMGPPCLQHCPRVSCSSRPCPRPCPLHPQAISPALLAGDSVPPRRDSWDEPPCITVGLVSIRMLLWHGDASFPCAGPVQL